MLELMQGDSEGLKREQAWQGQLKKGTGQAGADVQRERVSKKGTGQVGKSKKEQAMLELMQGDSEGLKREQAWQGQLKKGTGYA